MSRDAYPLAIAGNTPVCERCGLFWGSKAAENLWYRLARCEVCEEEDQLCATASDFKYLPRLPAEIAARILARELRESGPCEDDRE